MSTPERDIMHLRNKVVVGLAITAAMSVGLIARAQSQAPQVQQKIQATPLPSDVDPSDPAVPAWARPATPPKSASNASDTTTSAGNVRSGKAAAPDLAPATTDTVDKVTTDEKGGFRFVKKVDEVTLTASVLDQRKHLVTDLGKANFTVYEDGQPQEIKLVRPEDIPVSIGILVDNSGSMRTKRNAVSKAVVNLVQASNPDDEVFVVNFNDEPYLDQDFTNKVALMKEALDRSDTRGGTALYDAVIAAADHLAKGAKREKKVLLVVTDGEDNESRRNLEDAIRSVQNENGPTIYTIGILDEGKQRRIRRALEGMSLQTGGVAFFPKNLDEVDEISREVAHDIRNQYRITYKPSNPGPKGVYHQVRVEAHAPGYKELQVRTRTGYYAEEQKSNTANR